MVVRLSNSQNGPIYFKDLDLLDLDLVLPVPLGTSGSSLAPFRTVSCNIVNLLPLEVDHLQILLESSAPRLLGASCFTPAIRWTQDIATFPAR